MRLSTVLGGAILSFVLPHLALADVHGSPYARRHDAIARRASNDVGHLHKRAFNNVRFTFYDVGLGACGKYNKPGDFIVALTAQQFGGGYPGPNCFKSITISYGGKTAQATIMDECMGCPYGGLDFSRGLFDYFADEGKGVLSGDWWFNDDPPHQDPPPQTHHDAPPPPTTKHTTPPPTSHTPTSTSHITRPTTSSHPTTSHSSTSSTTSSTPSPTPTPTPSSTSTSTSTPVPTPTGPNVLAALSQAYLGLGAIVVNGAAAAQ